MKVSTHRLDRYAAIAACGSGAVGLAVSPLHGDIQYFGSEITLNLPGGQNTSGSSFRTISGGGVSWCLVGSRQNFLTTSTFFSSWATGFSYTSFRQETGTTSWFASIATIAPNLFNAGDLIDLTAMQSGSGYIALNRRSFSGYTIRRSSSSSAGSSFMSTGTFFYSTSGAMAAGERGFLALSFELDGETVFGWADISLSTDLLSMTVHGWAFEDSGAAILAGQTENATAVPGLGGLAALACGAAGMRRKRERVA